MAQQRLQQQNQNPEGNGGGVIAAVAAFVIWGVSPLYWKQIQRVPPLELIAHRLVWALLILVVVVAWRRRWPHVRAALGDMRQAGLYGLSGALLSANWITYVWAVNTGRIVETSLGYFLNPLVNVLLGSLVLRERLRPVQWCAVACAAAGVVVQVALLARVPWIAFVLAVTFGLYGLLRKTGPLGPLAGLAVETALLAPFAIGFLLWLELNGQGAMRAIDAAEFAFVAGTGALTVAPLLLFATAASRLTLTALGLIQYIAPSLQLAVGVLVYREAFSAGTAASFAFIWTGLAIYTWDGLREARRQRARDVPRSCDASGAVQ